jgi:hypothetical protein
MTDSSGTSGNSGGCVLDGVYTDCSVVNGLALSGGLVVHQNGLLPAGAILLEGIGWVICGASGACEVVIAVGVIAVGAVLIYNEITDWKVGNFPTVQEIQAKCTPKGPPVIVPSDRKRNRNGGQSIEQEYLCPDGKTYTIHTLVNKNGRILDQHAREGGPRYGPK